MKMVVEREFCQLSEGVTSNNFRIKASAKAFKILSSGLYSDKIKAIIRELGTNALDAHISVGNEAPFDVCLPTSLDRTFYVRDYGPGLSPEELGVIEGIPGLYTTYFDSNKTDSNDVVGCLGLGSKSPFSYTDNFIVESFQHGRQYICSAHIDETGQPAISLLETRDTNEPDGLKVGFSVQYGDVTTFANKAKAVYKHFSLQPNMVGAKIVIEPKEFIVEGTDWKLYKFNHYEAHNATAIMGCVEYPIKTDSSYFNSEEIKLIELPFEIHFKIGELDFDAGREQLGYDKKTIAVIKAKCRQIRDEIKEKFKDVYKDCKSLWEVRCTAFAVYKNLNSIANMIELPDDFNGQKVGISSSKRSIDIDVKGVQINELYTRRTRVKKYIQEDIKPDTSILLYENDVKTGSMRRCKSLLDNGKHVCLIHFANQNAKKEFCDVLGFEESYLLKVSSLPKPIPTPRSSGSGEPLNKICKFESNGSTNSSDYWTNDEISLEDGGIYVELNRGKAIIGEKHLHGKEIQDILDALAFVSEEVDLIGIKTALKDKVKSMTDWMELTDVVREVLVDNQVEDDILISEMELRENIDGDMSNFAEVLRKLHVKNDFLTKFDELNGDSSKDAIKCSHINTLRQFVNFKGNPKKLENGLDNLYKEVIIKYPLLQIADSFLWQKDKIEMFKDYIKLIDEKESK